MNLYHLKATSGLYWRFHLVIAEMWNRMPPFDGTPIPETWKPPRMKRIAGEEDRKISDYPYLSPAIPVFNEKALDVFRDVLEPRGQLFKADCDEGDYWLYNLRNIVDALDREKMDSSYFPDGRVMTIKRYAFHEGKIDKSESIFKIPDRPTRPIVTDAFVKRAEQAKLTGMVFEKIWPWDAEKAGKKK